MAIGLGTPLLLDARVWFSALTVALPLPLSALVVPSIEEEQASQETVVNSKITELSYKTIIVEDEELPVDIEVEETEGSSGKIHTYVVEREDGTRVIEQNILEEPVDRVIHKGTAFDLPIVAAPAIIETPEPETSSQEDGVEEAGSRSSSQPELTQAPTSATYSVSDLMFMGVINWNGYKFTYYSQSELPGPGLSIPGRHVNEGGYVADGDGYMVLAAPYGIAHGTVFSTPFGYDGKVYDTCASCSTSPMWLDVYTR